MPLYNYQALDNKGKKHSGLVEGNTQNEAKEKLRHQGLMVTSLAVKTGATSKENIKGEQLVAFTMQLSQLVSAGMPVFESLNALEEQYRNEPFHRVLLSLCEKIKGGASLSEAMREFPGTFNQLYCSMVMAGESAGALSIVLKRLSEFLTKQERLRREIQSAMIYPSILAGFTLLIVAALLGFVVPSIEGIFAGRELNSFTEFVMQVSYVFRNYWWVYVPLIVATVGYLVYQFRTPAGKQWFQKTMMRLPLVKTMMTEAALARFCRTMGTLQEGGVNVIESLTISREVMQNATLENEIKKAEGKIIEGSSLSEELSHSVWIPRLVSRMLAVSEESGTSTDMFHKIADMYEEHLEKTINKILALSQPVILIVMGVVIGAVIMAILLPLTDMSSFAL